ncbi:MAG: hypothetical protein M3Y55_07465, partial [Pseudomonadota bacterium]|nr:hypothetical protein [Pseudomonadota bacterium]
ASAEGLKWSKRDWTLVNHWVPFAENEVGAPGAFESNFMAEHLAAKSLSTKAAKVLAEGKKLWIAYFEHTDTHTTRKEWHLERPDVGWYQVRNVLKERNASGDFPVVAISSFEEAYAALTDHIRPRVYTLGFLAVDE